VLGEMQPTPDKTKPKRKQIARAELEQVIAEAVKAGDPECQEFVGVIVEHVTPAAPEGANWAVKGIKYGKADRARCDAALSVCVAEKQREFEISD
jgi:hypothetical protein